MGRAWSGGLILEVNLFDQMRKGAREKVGEVSAEGKEWYMMLV